MICCSKFTLQINKQRVQGLQQATQNYLQVSLMHELNMSFCFILCTQSQCSLPKNSLRSERILIHLLTKDPRELNAQLCTKEQKASELHGRNTFYFSYPKSSPPCSSLWRAFEQLKILAVNDLCDMGLEQLNQTPGALSCRPPAMPRANSLVYR